MAYVMHNLCTTFEGCTTLNEHNTQRLVVAWFREQYPHLRRRFFAIPNGGKRGIVAARRLSDEGVIAGVPDLFLACPRGGMAGLWLELKTLRGRCSADQREMHAELIEGGYAVAVAKGYDDAKRAITTYLEQP